MEPEKINEAQEAIHCAIINLDNVVKMAPMLQLGRTLLPVVRHQLTEAMRILGSDLADLVESGSPFPPMPKL